MGGTADWRRIDSELGQAHVLRDQGRLGRARVCARRAAGWAIGPVYHRCTGDEPPASALRLLTWYRGFAEAPEPLRRAAARLTAHVDRTHNLPHPEDPVEDARLLVEALRASAGDLPV